MHILNQDIEFVEENRPCSYFDERISDIRYKYIYSCSSTQYQGMLERGWRRFGKMHFVPECKECTKCVSIRIDVANYKFSKSNCDHFSLFAGSEFAMLILSFDIFNPMITKVKCFQIINYIQF